MARDFSAPSPLVTGLKAIQFAGGSAGTFATTGIEAEDVILYVESHSSLSNAIPAPIIGEGDAYTRLRSQSSASVVADDIVGLDYATTDYFNIVHYIDANSGATTY